MNFSSSRRFADKVQEWSSTLAGVTNSIQDSLPRSPTEVRQKFRSWNQALSKHRQCAFTNKCGPHSNLTSAEKLRAAELESLRLESELKAARKAVAENAKIREELRELESIDSKLATNGVKSRACRPAANSRHTTSTVEPTTGCQIEMPTHIRGPRRASNQFSSATGYGEDVQFLAVSDPRATHSMDRGEASQCPPPKIDSRLHRSASASHLADQVRDTLQRLKRSASNVNLRKKFIRSAPGDTSDLEAPMATLRHSAPPGSLPGRSSRRQPSLRVLRPDRQANSPEPLLGSIGEDEEYQWPDGPRLRRDPIFAFHEYRSFSPGISPIFIDKIPLPSVSSFAQRRESVTEPENSRQTTQDPKRSSSHRLSRRYSTTSQLENQIDRISDMNTLRASINNTRAVRDSPPLEFHQTLCAEAGIVATMYDILNDANESSWSTRIQLQELGTTLELVGPPGVGGRVTGKMWADGAHSRETQSNHSKFSRRDHRGCQCHNFKVWEAITDVRWRAIGIGRTEEEERWVVVLSE